MSVALLNDRRLSPAFAEAAPAPPRTSVGNGGLATASLPSAKTFITRRILIAMMLAMGGMAVAASIPAVTAFATNLWLPSSSVQTAGVQGPSTELRAAAGVGGNWERSVASAAAPVEGLGALAIAGAHERDYQALVSALNQLAEEKAAATARAAAAPPLGASFSRNAASGYAVGTVLNARITIYGCVGPGGGFCGGMAGGGRVFEGAAACSSDLPFGTKVKIHGDPTGRVYECLDRGALHATWVDVYFYNTSDGIAWQSALGGTVARVEIVN
ncbi:MAG: hypothetical protein WD359_01710 [Dehalococcoidia bacterium]